MSDGPSDWVREIEYYQTHATPYCTMPGNEPNCSCGDCKRWREEHKMGDLMSNLMGKPVVPRRGMNPDQCESDPNVHTTTGEHILGLSPSDPIETNEAGGQQSAIGYRLDLLDGHAILRLGEVLKEGADKGYEKNNWMKIPASDHVNHALGHLMAYLIDDPDFSTEDHLGHAFCRLMFAVRMDGEGID